MDILSYEGFAGALKDSLPVFLGPEWEVEEKITFRINERKPTLNIYKSGHKHDAVMPNIYLDDFYREYEEGREICSILNDIADIAKNAPCKEELGVSISEDSLKKSMIMVVINAAVNEEYLKQLPHRRFLDLAVVLRAVKFSDDGSGMGAMITRQIADSWGMSDEELFKMARVNCATMVPAYVFDVHGMITITNLKGSYGAINGLCNNDVLDGIAKIAADDIYIVPSSIHEVFAVPASDFDAESLKAAAVDAVRTGVVSDRDFLSKNVYCYSREKRELRVI